MTVQPTQGGANAVAAGRLWAGGLATAVIAGLIAVAGILLARGVFDVPVLAPEGEGTWGDADTWTYALYCGLAALVATGLLHLLLISTPRPFQFFGWIISLATAVAALAPFATSGSTSSKIATGLINLIVGIAIGALLPGAARAAMRARAVGR
ncbi:DUF6069 family protein [Kribbella sp. VKM Ac-2568]|uniref:DUF6069 family protein n=1 Tax=Kribbella sp. VKM Ac-2568 TaxID=2512219 RepID=UPI00104B0A0D|nr:DUF6069 family protein [Kribbella sp. VKM Ac-2568]TCM40402.1 hypothetical protein EV648_113225 [Kribbella sp. VKM Ac-2568]